jgi:PIN domain nuclease of toxin-antitoxin system
MIYLVDTNVLVWLSMVSSRLNGLARDLLADPDNTIYFSAISILEISIKQQLGKPYFDAEAGPVRRAMLDKGYLELPVNGLHAAFVGTMPLIHRDPFDRLLIAQASVEGITLITADEEVAKYSGPILKL